MFISNILIIQINQGRDKRPTKLIY